MATVTALQVVVLVLSAAAFSLHVSGLVLPEWVVANYSVKTTLGALNPDLPAPFSMMNATLVVDGTQGLFETCGEASVPELAGLGQPTKVREWECNKRDSSCSESDRAERNCLKMESVIAFSIMGTILSIVGLIAAALWTFKNALKDRFAAIVPLVAAIFMVIGLIVYSTVESDSDNKIGICVWLMIAGAIANLIAALIMFTGKAGPYTSTVFRLE